MAIKVNSAAFTGVQGIMVAVEVDIGRGLPSFNIVGLGDVAVKESKERVRTSLINSGFEFPVGRITVNLAPADVKKEGSLFDLAIAIGILKESSQITMDIDDYIFLDIFFSHIHYIYNFLIRNSHKDMDLKNLPT